MLFSGNLRRDYELLHMLEEEHIKMGRSKREIDNRPMIQSLKEGIRNTLREQKRHLNEPHWKAPRAEDWDRRYVRLEYSGIFTKEDSEEYIEEEWQHWYNPWDDGRDCTGVWFTSSICIFPIPKANKTIVYHFQDCDV